MGAVRAFALIAAVATAVIATPSAAHAADGTITSPTQGGSPAKVGQTITVAAHTDGACEPALRVRTPAGKLVLVATGDAGILCGPATLSGVYVPDSSGSYVVLLNDATGATLSETALTVATPPAATREPTPEPTGTAVTPPPVSATPTPTPTVTKTVTVTKTPTPKASPTPTATSKAKVIPTPTVTVTTGSAALAPQAPAQQIPQVVINQVAPGVDDVPAPVFTPADTPAPEASTEDVVPVAFKTVEASPVPIVVGTLGAVGLVALLGWGVWMARHRGARSHSRAPERLM